MQLHACPDGQRRTLTLRTFSTPWFNPGKEYAGAERYLVTLTIMCTQMIINEIVVEATGVELILVLRACRLLISGNATTAKSAPLPDWLYVYCTKIFRSGLTLTPPPAPYSRGTLRFVREKTRPRFANLAPEALDRLGIFTKRTPDGDS